MAEFAPAVEYVLSNEGGYVNDPHDPGGATNFGISQASYPQLDIKSLTRDEAIQIYQRDYWKFGALTSQRLATKMLDIYVNLPPAAAIRLLQMAVGYLVAGPIVADGVLGPQTIEAANECDENGLVNELKARMVSYYFKLGASNLDDLFGWIRRAVKG